MRRLIPIAAVLAVILAWRLASQQPPPRTADPSTHPVEHRPGAWFPEGFPLHGAVKLLTAPVVEMGQRARIRVEYTVGDVPIEPGMAIEVWKHFTSDVEEFQVSNPDAPAWFAAEFSTPGVEARASFYTNAVQRNTVSVFPYRKAAAVTIDHGTLRAGDKVNFDLGGQRGVRMQHYEEALFNFRFVLTRDEKVLGYAGDAVMKVTGGPIRQLRVQAPSVVKLGERFPVEIVPQDEWASQAKNSEGLSFRITSSGVSGRSFRWEEPLLHYVARDVTAATEGVLRIAVQTADGQFRGLSNPIWVERDPLRRPYYGELHQHTYLHDGRGVFEELYLYGRRVGLLDFGAVTPHHMPLSVTGPQFYLAQRFPVDEWPHLQQVTRTFNGWQDFVSVLGYEYSVGTNLGGHHNIFYNADQAASTMQLDPKEPAAPIAKMLQTVQLARVPTLVIPHIGGGPPDWSHPTDQRVERLFEIASVHGVFEESWQRHLRHGLRLGAIGAGDTHTTSMGIAYPGLIYVNSNALAGVWAYAKNRKDIWNGLYERRTFAATGNQRMLVDFRVNGERMGGEIRSQDATEASIEARISGTAPLLRVELIKNGQVIHSLAPARNPGGSTLRVVWGDNVYQRRACVSLRSGELRAEGGRLRHLRNLNLDQAFEEVRQAADGLAWSTASVSGDRDGALVDIAEVTGAALSFRHDDSADMGLFETRIPLDALKQDGHFAWSQKGKLQHAYMQKMGVDPAFFLECELVNPDAPMDLSFRFVHREPPKPGDYYYLRVEQLDTNQAWSSPVWVN